MSIRCALCLAVVFAALFAAGEAAFIGTLSAAPGKSPRRPFSVAGQSEALSSARARRDLIRLLEPVGACTLRSAQSLPGHRDQGVMLWPPSQWSAAAQRGRACGARPDDHNLDNCRPMDLLPVVDGGLLAVPVERACSIFVAGFGGACSYRKPSPFLRRLPSGSASPRPYASGCSRRSSSPAWGFRVCPVRRAGHFFKCGWRQTESGSPYTSRRSRAATSASRSPS